MGIYDIFDLIFFIFIFIDDDDIRYRRYGMEIWIRFMGFDMDNGEDRMNLLYRRKLEFIYEFIDIF
jgi:hypothetical protein